MKTFAAGRSLRLLLSLALTAAILLGVAVPMAVQTRVEPDNPIEDSQIRDVGSIHIGDAPGEVLGADGAIDETLSGGSASHQSGGETGETGGNAPSEQQNTDTPEEQELPETPPEQPDPDEDRPEPDEQPQEPDKQPEEGRQPEEPDEGDDPAGGTEPTPDENGQLVPDGTGSDGDTVTDLDLGLVLTWYKYGRTAKTVVCAPDRAVRRDILQEQLREDELRYALSFTGADADLAEITGVTFGLRDGKQKEAGRSGSVELSLPRTVDSRSYAFVVTALVGEGETAAETTFTVVIRYSRGVDLELQLWWEREDRPQLGRLICAPDATRTEQIKSSQLGDGFLHYEFRMEGDSAETAEIVSAEYWADRSGEHGDLRTPDGRLELTIPEGEQKETYTITAVVEAVTEDEDGEETIHELVFTYELDYEDGLDIGLDFVWYDENGMTSQKLTCTADKAVHGTVPQRKADSLSYHMEATGRDKDQLRQITGTWSSSSGQSGRLVCPDGSLTLAIPEGASRETYTLQLRMEVNHGGKIEEIPYTVVLKYQKALELTFGWMVEGEAFEKKIAAGKTVTLEEIKQNQLTNDLLPYTLTLSGENAGGAFIESVSLYREGLLDTVTPEGSALQLATNNGKKGINELTVLAKDAGGSSYKFIVKIPYLPAGDGAVKIEVSGSEGFEDGGKINNETQYSFTVRVWSETRDGVKLQDIFYDAKNGKLSVTLDGEPCLYQNRSGSGEAFACTPAGADKGDTNEHKLRITAKDDYGNEGELIWTLTGTNTAADQPITATVILDMSVLGLGTEKRTYTCLPKENVAQSVAKVLWGEDLGEPFGKADSSFDWVSGSYENSYDNNFYLAGLRSGDPIRAKVMNDDRGDSDDRDSSWFDFGDTEEAQLAAIDQKLGKGTELAALWRCLCRSGVPLSPQSDPKALRESDFTKSSGWMYSINGEFATVSMSDKHLQDGDTLRIVFTLANGADVGGGADWLCVSSENGRLRFNENHRFEEVVDAEGVTHLVCPCCGMEQSCPHLNTHWIDNGDGTCSQKCNDCGEIVRGPQKHEMTDWEYMDEQQHSAICANKCGYKERQPHTWREVEGSSTATCTEAGTRTLRCDFCGAEKTEEVPALGHEVVDDEWSYDNLEHWKTCARCGQEIEGSRGAHDFVYENGDWVCRVCGAGHDFELCGKENLVLQEAQCTEHEKVYICSVCGQTFREPGDFPEYAPGGGETPDPGPIDPDPGPVEPEPCVHEYEYDEETQDWVCILCGMTHKESDCGVAPEELHPDGRKSTCQCLVYICPACGEELRREGGPGDFPDYHRFENGVCTVCNAADPDFVSPEPEPEPEPETGGGGEGGGTNPDPGGEAAPEEAPASLRALLPDHGDGLYDRKKQSGAAFLSR